MKQKKATWTICYCRVLENCLVKANALCGRNIMRVILKNFYRNGNFHLPILKNALNGTTVKNNFPKNIRRKLS